MSPEATPTEPGPRQRRERRWLAAILLAGVAFRLWWARPFAPSPAWSDPDHYLHMAGRLANHRTGWLWSWQAVDYAEFVKAPLYQVVLSLATWLGPDAWAIRPILIAHALLPGLTIVAVWSLGRTLGSPRAGLLAAALYAGWAPNILLTSSLWQEHLYIPLLTGGFALLARAIVTGAPWWHWALTGAVLGLAALTRSSIAYFVPVLVVAGGALTVREAGLRRAAALFIGFVVITAPYVSQVSRSARQFVPIENIGAHALRRADGGSQATPPVRLTRFMEDPSAAPRGREVARFLLADFRADPGAFLATRFEYLQNLLKPGGASLQHNTETPSRSAAWATKVLIHLAVDLPVAAVTLLWPLALVWGRRPLAAGLVAAWIPFLGAMVVTTLWAGTRFRSPVEPVAIALTAVALSSPWRAWRPTATTALPAALTATLAVLVAPALAETARAFPTYGVDGWSVTTPAEARIDGRAGLNRYAGTPALPLVLTADAAAGLTDVEVRVDGHAIDRVTLSGGETHAARYPLPSAGLVYVELIVTDADGRPATVRVAVP